MCWTQAICSVRRFCRADSEGRTGLVQVFTGSGCPGHTGRGSWAGSCRSVGRPLRHRACLFQKTICSGTSSVPSVAPRATTHPLQILGTTFVLSVLISAITQEIDVFLPPEYKNCGTAPISGCSTASTHNHGASTSGSGYTCTGRITLVHHLIFILHGPSPPGFRR